MNFDDLRLSGDRDENEPIILDGFLIEHRSYVNDEGVTKHFCTMCLDSEKGRFKFILLPEEMKKLAEVGLETIEGIEMREEMMPTIIDPLSK